MRSTHVLQMARRFVITGCGRSGTGYLAALLGELGIACGHERVFGEELLERDEPGAWPEGVDGDCSWLAAPFLDRLEPGTLVIHHAREPVSVVRSLLRIRLFEGKSAWKRFAQRHAPRVGAGTPIERCVAYWLDWNRLAMRASGAAGLAFRAQRLEDLDVDHVVGLCALVHAPRTADEVARALARVPRDTNTSGAKAHDATVGWSHFARGTLGAELADLAARLGYAGESVDGTLRVTPRAHPNAPLRAVPSTADTR